MLYSNTQITELLPENVFTINDKSARQTVLDFNISLKTPESSSKQERWNGSVCSSKAFVLHISLLVLEFSVAK